MVSKYRVFSIKMKRKIDNRKRPSFVWSIKRFSFYGTPTIHNFLEPNHVSVHVFDTNYITAHIFDKNYATLHILDLDYVTAHILDPTYYYYYYYH